MAVVVASCDGGGRLPHAFLTGEEEIGPNERVVQLPGVFETEGSRAGHRIPAAGFEDVILITFENPTAQRINLAYELGVFLTTYGVPDPREHDYEVVLTPRS